MLIAQKNAGPGFSAGDIVRPTLTKLQWSVVHIAISDVGHTGCFLKFFLYLTRMASVVGMQPKWMHKAPLANPELECLRQYACLCRQSDGAAHDLVPALLDAGFDRDALATLAKMIGDDSREC